MNIFDYIAPYYDRVFHRVQQKQKDTLLREVAITPGIKVLDIGGGTGKLACQFVKEGAEVTMVDKSQGMLNTAKGRCEMDWVEALAENLPFAAESFDLVVSVDALHHFQEREEALMEMVRVLKRNGSIAILDLERQYWFTRLICLGERLIGEKSVFYNAFELEEIFREQGLEVQVIRPSRLEFLVIARKS